MNTPENFTCKLYMEKTKIIFVANPNNPTGTYVTAKEVESFLERVPRDVIVCFDEAYVDFVDEQDFPHMLDYLKGKYDYLVIMRTFSKSYGLAGLRVGYAVKAPRHGGGVPRGSAADRNATR